jgi:hypothetical protein
LFLILSLAFLISSPQVLTQTKSATPPHVLSRIASSSDRDRIEFAAIGDYGSNAQDLGPDEKRVAKMVEDWDPDFIITLGDNNYEHGEAGTIVKNIGKYYCDYIYNKGAPRDQQCEGWADDHEKNLFFPSLGNHDWRTANAKPYIDYFTKLPGNRRYYDFVFGPVHFFVIDSQSQQECCRYWKCEDCKSCKECKKPIYYEPDGTTPDSKQGRWLRDKLKESTSPWKLVYFHHAPYSCKRSSEWMRWPFREWGASAVLAGHEHLYERGWLKGQEDFPYFVNGTGGTELSKCREGDCDPDFVEVTIGKKLHGAMWVKATGTEIHFMYYDAESEELLDECRLIKTGSGQKLDCQESGRGKPKYCPPSKK